MKNKFKILYHPVKNDDSQILELHLNDTKLAEFKDCEYGYGRIEMSGFIEGYRKAANFRIENDIIKIYLDENENPELWAW